MPANGGRLEKPKIREQVLSWLADGRTPSEIARMVPVVKGNKPITSQAICAFRNRHAAELALRVERIEKAIEDYTIAQKVHRIADAQLRRDLLELARQSRAAGGTGMETGIVARTYKNVGAGEFAETVEEYRIDTAMLAEWRANDRHVAEELAQLPRSPEAQVNVQINVGIVLRWDDGDEA